MRVILSFFNKALVILFFFKKKKSFHVSHCQMADGSGEAPQAAVNGVARGSGGLLIVLGRPPLKSNVIAAGPRYFNHVAVPHFIL